MVQLARGRLEPFSDRASVLLSDGGPPDSEPTDSCDRFVANYVLDLLPESEIRNILQSARRMLSPDGLLCITCLSTGIGPSSRAVARAWSWVQGRWPAAVGGCRPVDMLAWLHPSAWHIRFHRKVAFLGITSQVVIAMSTAHDTGPR